MQHAIFFKPRGKKRLPKGDWVIKKCVLAREKKAGKMKSAEGGKPTAYEIKEVTDMALSNLSAWKDAEAAAACGTACGAADKPEEKPAACGSACGAGDQPAETPAACGAADKPVACGTACGTADKPEEKPAACGAACGAGDK